MIRLGAWKNDHTYGLPRMRGDDPDMGKHLGDWELFAPHARG